MDDSDPSEPALLLFIQSKDPFDLLKEHRERNRRRPGADLAADDLKSEGDDDAGSQKRGALLKHAGGGARRLATDDDVSLVAPFSKVTEEKSLGS